MTYSLKFIYSKFEFDRNEYDLSCPEDVIIRFRKSSKQAIHSESGNMFTVTGKSKTNLSLFYH